MVRKIGSITARDKNDGNTCPRKKFGKREARSLTLQNEINWRDGGQALLQMPQSFTKAGARTDNFGTVA